MTSLLLLLKLYVMLSMIPSSGSITIPRVHGWRDVTVHSDKAFLADETMGQSVSNFQECLRLCWRVTSCDAVSYSRGSDSLCRMSDAFQTNERHMTDDVTSMVVDMRNARMNKTNLYGCDKRPCLDSQMCVTVNKKNKYLCLGTGNSNCGTPASLPNTIVSTDGFGRAFYSCLPEFVSTSPQEMTSFCNNQTGRWSTMTFTCTQVRCGEPPQVENAQRSYVSTTLGALATYTCVLGYTTQGQMAISCQADGNWTEAPDPCIPVDCGQPVAVANGIVRLPTPRIAADDTRTHYGGSAFHSCQPGFVSPVDFYTSTCQEDGQWSMDGGFACSPVDCGPPLGLEWTTMTFNATTHLSIVSYACAPGYDFAGGTNTSVCLPTGSWSPVDMSCLPLDCMLPVLIGGILADVDNTTFGSRAKLSCQDDLHVWEGDKEIHCNSSGSWSPVQGRCVAAPCGDLPSVPHANVTVNKSESRNGFEIEAKFICQHGYRFEQPVPGDVLILTCVTTTPSWQGNAIVGCQLVSCRNPPSVSNSDVITTNDLVYQSTAVYTCNHGYQHASPTTNRTCTHTGEWTHENITCQPRTCRSIDLPNILNSQPIPIGKEDFLLGESLTYECVTDYIISTSNDTVTCGAHSEWSSTDVQCILVQCGAPPLVRNSTYEIRLEALIFHVVHYRCDGWFKLRDESVNSETCRFGQWSSSAVECIPDGCGTPPDVPDARMTFTSSSPGSTVVYTCNDGFHLTAGEPDRRVCNPSLDWSTENIVCRRRDCRDPPALRHSDTRFTDTTFGSTASYVCHSGYRVANGLTMTLHCAHSGDWEWESRANETHCERVTCPDPPPVDNARLALRNRPQVDPYVYEDSVRYECENDYVLSYPGNTVRVCNESGMWEGEIVCSLNLCPEPTLENANFTDVDRRIDKDATYVCLEGYRIMQGSQREATLTCLRTLEWSTTRLLCLPVDCFRPPLIDNATASVRSTTLGAIVNYTCDRSMELETGSNSSKTCLATGLWSQEPVSCVPPVDNDVCPLPPMVDNASSHYDSRKPGADVHYKCESGLQHWWFETRTCTDQMSWSNETVLCKMVDCGTPPSIHLANVVVSSTTLQSIARYVCVAPNERKSESSSKVCLEHGNWSKAFIECGSTAASACGDPPAIENAEVAFSSVLNNADAFYHCVDGFEFKSRRSPIYTCLSGNWVGPDIQCSPKNCGSPVIATNSDILSEFNKTSFGSTARYSCKAGKVIASSSERRCQADGTWSDDVIECFPTSSTFCKSPPEMPASTASFTSHTVGSLARYTCNEGYTGSLASYKCTTIGVWREFDRGTTCEPVDCGQPPDLRNTVKHFTSTRYESLALYTCSNTTVERRPMRSRCLSNGSWAFVNNYCDACSMPPPEVQNAILISVAPVPGGKATYECKPGFKNKQSLAIERTCLETGLWTNDDATGCEADCDHPPTFPNTEMIVTEKRATFISVVYNCLEGFRIPNVVVGDPTSESLTCFNDVGWPSNVVNCQPVDCGVPPDLELPVQLANGTTTYLSVANYECSLVQTFETSICQADGAWSPVDPDFCPKCDMNATIEGGHLVPYNGTVAISGYSNKALVVCDANFTLILQNGQGSGFVGCLLNSVGPFWDDLDNIMCLRTSWLDPPMNFRERMVVTENMETFQVCFNGTPGGRDSFNVKLMEPSTAGGDVNPLLGFGVKFSKRAIVSPIVGGRKKRNVINTGPNVVNGMVDQGNGDANANQPIAGTPAGMDIQLLLFKNNQQLAQEELVYASDIVGTPAWICVMLNTVSLVFHLQINTVEVGRMDGLPVGLFDPTRFTVLTIEGDVSLEVVTLVMPG